MSDQRQLKNLSGVGAATISDLHILGIVVTNAHRRRVITKQIGLEAGLFGPILGTVRSDARLLYATTAGLIQKLTSSKALDDYADVLTRLSEVLP